jgi:hypothetical protein
MNFFLKDLILCRWFQDVWSSGVDKGGGSRGSGPPPELIHILLQLNNTLSVYTLTVTKNDSL